MSKPLQHLASTLAARLERISESNPDVGRALDHLLSAVRNATPRPSFDTVGGDYAALLSRTIIADDVDGNGDIARALTALRGVLPWQYHYQPRSADEDLSDRIAFAELIGPDGPMIAPDCRVGFTLMAEDTIYPLHAHPAVELYFVLSGNAEWQTATTCRIVPPGNLVLHRSSEAHAMRTYAEPLLALWGWSGDLDTAAFYL